MLYDAKGRKYLIELVDDGEFQYHRGLLRHRDIIGTEEGTLHEASLGSKLLAVRPRLADYILKMGRGATVVYPKDAGAILLWADIGPGMTVLEAGTGSGGLTMVLARAVGPGGKVVSYERRDDHAARARKLIRGFFGEIPPHVDLRVGDVEEAVSEVMPDRIVLDVPEPWHTVPAAAEHLPGGGAFCCYLPTVPQVQQVVEALKSARSFFEIETFEVLHREWVAEGRSVRPSHRMVGHTGFVTVARKRLRTVDS
jgi:tRNA (adenine57-N1/adenine58-N1)-methyltransferase